MICDRCESLHEAKIRTNCKVCGPTPLCDECDKIHQGELDLEKSLENLDENFRD